jgi:uncharacterized membrane protein
MDRIQTRNRALFASGLIAMALTGLRFGDFASILQEIPKWVPARTAIPYAGAAVMLAAGIGLLFARTVTLAARVTFGYLALWFLLLNLPIVVKSPLVEVNWQGLGEITVMLAGGWVLFASLVPKTDGIVSNVAGGARGMRRAQIIFGLALLPLGLAHIVYLGNTAPLVPAWLPGHTAWAYITGAAQIAAGWAVLLSIVPRLAATLDAVLLSCFTFLVWVPLLVAKPASPDLWSELTISWAITAGAWVVAASMPRRESRFIFGFQSRTQ